MKPKWPFAIPVAAVFTSLLATAPAHGVALEEKRGVQVSQPNFIKWPGPTPLVERLDKRGKCATSSSGVVKMRGDVVYVADDCSDGGAAAVKWSIVKGGKKRVGTCRNHHGAKSWAQCNFNWKEGVTIGLVALTYNSKKKKYSKDQGYDAESPESSVYFISNR